jgi:uncharacterized SAM-binding protein YcdF (DUF218 family)
MNSSWRRALVGTSIGFLAATAVIVAGIPGIPGGHAGLCLTGCVASGALVGWFDWTKVVAYATLVAAIVVGVVTMTPLVDRPVAAWIRRDTLPSTPLDAVVVLSSSVNRDGVLDVSGTERLLSGLAVWRRNHARLLITTRVEERAAQGIITSDADQRALTVLGGDTSAWRVVAPAHTTHDEAVRTGELLAPASARSIAVVTSPLHTRRACATFEALGFHVVCIPSDERRYAVHTLPGPADRFAAFFDLLYERLAMIKYRARGWVFHH